VRKGGGWGGVWRGGGWGGGGWRGERGVRGEGEVGGQSGRMEGHGTEGEGRGGGRVLVIVYSIEYTHILGDTSVRWCAASFEGGGGNRGGALF